MTLCTTLKHSVNQYTIQKDNYQEKASCFAVWYVHTENKILWIRHYIEVFASMKLHTG